MNNKTITEFGFRIIWRIVQISEGVIRLAYGLDDVISVISLYYFINVFLSI